MYQPTFGTKQQISFNSESEYYELLGYLSKSDGSTILVWENNDDQGAWEKEGRILFFENQPANLRAKLLHTAGVGNILSRVNCNEFIICICKYHNFIIGGNQNKSQIESTIPADFLRSFNEGFDL